MRHTWPVALLLTLVVLAGCGAAKAPPPPTSPSPAPTPTPAPNPPQAAGGALPSGFQPASIAFWDDSHGLLTGNAGCSDKCVGYLAVTADGGKNWQVAYQGGALVGDAAVAASSAGWAAVSSCPNVGDTNCDNFLVATTDGGKTWNTIKQGARYLSFVDAKLGWAMPPGRDASGLLASSDGGLSWQTLTSPCRGELGMGGYPSRVSAQQGYVGCVGQPATGQQKKAIYATSDGGKTWTEVGRPGMSGYLRGLFFRPSGHGWLLRARGNLAGSTDGGKTWQDSPLTKPEEIEAEGLSFPSDSTGFVLLRVSGRRIRSLMKTVDGGHTWLGVHDWPMA